MKTLFLLCLLSIPSFAGLSTEAKEFKAKKDTRYYWIDKKGVREGICREGELVGLESCGSTYSQRRTQFLRSVEKGVRVLLETRLKYKDKRGDLEKKLQFITQQLEQLKSLSGANIEYKRRSLESAKKETEAGLALLSSPKDIWSDFDKGLHSDPKLVAFPDDGLFPSAGEHIDLLPVVFRLVPPETAIASSCYQDHPNRLHILMKMSVRAAGVGKVCSQVGAELVTVDELIDQKIDVVDLHFAELKEKLPGCTKFMGSRVGKAIGAHRGETRSVWIQGTRGVRLVHLSGDGKSCRRPMPRPKAEEVAAVVCVVRHGMRTRREFFSKALNKLPCAW